MKNFLILTCWVLVFGWATATHAVTFDFAQIGNAGNAADTHGDGYGAVAYNYAISKTEVTNAQYVEFLNGVAATDPYRLYSISMGNSTRAGITRTGSPGSYSYAVKADAAGQGPDGAGYKYADKPVIHVSWFDSVRFTNWLHNGQGAGDTETGAYTLLGGTSVPSNGLSVTRNSGAQYWLPCEDEWYKAAYYDASTSSYFDYATGANTAPDNNLPSAETGNSANHDNSGYTHNYAYPLTDVGAYGLTESPYGTYDQNGNVWEWNDTLSFSSRVLRGGAWSDGTNDLAALIRVGVSFPAGGNIDVGFRVASIPEPTSLLLLVSLAGSLLLKRRR